MANVRERGNQKGEASGAVGDGDRVGIEVRRGLQREENGDLRERNVAPYAVKHGAEWEGERMEETVVGIEYRGRVGAVVGK